MKFTLPISPEYVAHWGLWEAVREIYQNALDESSDSNCKATINYSGGLLRIATSRGRLSPDTLVLGKTSKRTDDSKRGKFGEGYKLALLVLARLGHEVQILTGNELWYPKIEHNESFDSDVLNIYIESSTECEGVEFVICGVQPEQWETIQKNIRPSNEFYSTILDDDTERGRIYVGGLYVSTAKEFHCGYAFAVGKIKLDRDRGMVNGFDLAYETSNLWTSRGGSRASELLEAEAADVRYVESHATASAPLVTYHSTYFWDKHGASAIPVSNQEEIERASKAGIKWVLVSETVKTLLRLVKSWFIPNTKSPVEQLRDFKNKYEWRMDSSMKQDLDEIIQGMGPKTKVAL